MPTIMTDIADLAVKFGDALCEELGIHTYNLVLEFNRTDKYKGFCASHDFCDANMVMLAVLKAEGYTEDQVLEDEAVRNLWNATWMRWKQMTK